MGRSRASSANYLYSFVSPKRPLQGVLAIGDLVVDLDQKTVEVSGEPVYLEFIEFGLLKVFAIHKEVNVTTEMIWNLLTGIKGNSEHGKIDYYMKHLRRKLLQAGSKVTIGGSPSQGYFLSHEADGAEHSSVA